jgi:GNAT superfamily N-acetyltransferase
VTAGHHLARQGAFLITSDPAATDIDLVCGFLHGTYWARDIPREALERSIRTALAYNLLDQTEGRQIGFARVVTDEVRFAWLSDVFVLDPYRGRGLARWLVRTALDDPRLRAVGRWLLATQDAHGLYRRLGFEDVNPGRYMLLTRPRPS